MIKASIDTIASYTSPIGEIVLAARDGQLIGLWFENQAHFASTLSHQHVIGENSAITKACIWLDAYFVGRVPQETPPVHLIGTPFQKRVWGLLLQIEYGKTTTYGEIAQTLSKETGLNVSPRSVGHAVSKNPVSIIVPCHRVIAKTGALTGYAGGIEKKRFLLALEKSRFI